MDDESIIPEIRAFLDRSFVRAADLSTELEKTTDAPDTFERSSRFSNVVELHLHRLERQEKDECQN